MICMSQPAKEHPKKNPREYVVSDLRLMIQRTKKLCGDIEGLLDEVEAGYGAKVTGLLAGVGRVWDDIQTVQSVLTTLANNAPAGSAKKRAK